MNNELDKYKTSDKIKWILTLLAFILVFVMLAGIMLGWFDKKEDTEKLETEQALVLSDIPTYGSREVAYENIC